LTEEIQAKDKLIQEARIAISQRENSIHKSIKQNGSLVPHPKEEAYNTFILAQMIRAEALQDEKIALADKACQLVNRHAKRLDAKMRELEKDGALPPDSNLTSSFANSMKSSNPFFDNFESYTSGAGDSHPLQSASGNVMPQVTVARRLVEQVSGSLTVRPNPTTAAVLASAHPRNSAPASPAAAHHLQQRHRESSAGAVDAKRRRLNTGLGSLPTASSSLRQSSLGPGTPKAGTPGSTRAGSAGPRAGGTKKATQKLAPHQQVRRLKATKTTKRPGGHRHKSHAHKNSPSSGGDEDSVVSEASDSENASQVRSAEDEEMDEADEKKYCTCRSVSYGDMIACDNDDCPYEWFHWACVGMTKEPVGKWFCPECRQKMG
jgi:inhibitor of growth protein 3